MLSDDPTTGSPAQSIEYLMESVDLAKGTAFRTAERRSGIT